MANLFHAHPDRDSNIRVCGFPYWKIASFTSVKTQEYLKPTISVPIAAGAEERKEKLFVALGVFAGQALF
jgi:hypothetical protein